MLINSKSWIHCLWCPLHLPAFFQLPELYFQSPVCRGVGTLTCENCWGRGHSCWCLWLAPNIRFYLESGQAIRKWTNDSMLVMQIAHRLWQLIRNQAQGWQLLFLSYEIRRDFFVCISCLFQIPHLPPIFFPIFSFYLPLFYKSTRSVCVLTQ